MAFLKVMDFKELCQILEIPEEEPQMEPPSPTGQPTDIHTFLASPSSTSKRWASYQHSPIQTLMGWVIKKKMFFKKLSE